MLDGYSVLAKIRGETKIIPLDNFDGDVYQFLIS